MAELVAIIILGLIIIAQGVERYFYTKQMTDKLSESMKAVMSRNINEFITATTANKASKTEFTPNDQVELEDADEGVFDKFIENQNK